MQLNRANVMALRTIQNMQNEEQNLLRNSMIPSNLDEALAAQVSHRHFQHAIEVNIFSWFCFFMQKNLYVNYNSFQNVNHVAAGFIQKTELLINSGNVDARALNELNEQVMSKWRRLVGLAEERNKLIKAAIGCYKTLHQGVGVFFGCYSCLRISSEL